ncbi:vitamin K epoxide reductase family protein [Synechococcus sp. CBW1004]|uniref:vitamin K epoxide reductase family protein n=1 Tax=Synechococcus sp. CBW1004 TaxID=1353136 RepID=UPI0018CE9345|nr:vitamin K epoxide reductase family protein [Synechococcus sp. CBW1004]QPN62183.1 vitamin K epoxide reductase family protein [Synechococcus sp. CBW1004]
MTSTRLADRLTTRRRSDTGNRWLRVAMAVLATVGVIDTATITLERWGLLGELSCPGGAHGCQKVLASPWGTVLGQPLSLYGLLAYGAVLILALLPLVLRGENRARIGPLSWWGLLLLSTGMTVFSLVLMGVMVFKIQAFCPFCVLSACLSLVLFVLSLVGGEWPDRGQLIFRVVLLALLVLLAGLGWSTAVGRPESSLGKGVPIPVTSPSTPATIALAEHLSRTGARMYSAYWCPHCHDQKELFGKEAAAKLTVIECAPDGRDSQAELCSTKNIQGYPSWEINGKLDSGVKPLARLAEMSGFKAGGE